jgi:hypothetical protein
MWTMFLGRRYISLKTFAKSKFKHLLNLSLTKFVWDVTPIEKWSGIKTSIRHLRTIKCIVWAHIPNDRRKKLDVKSHSCIIMGYSKESKAYMLFDLVKQEIIYIRDVVFDEETSSIAPLNSSFGLLRSDHSEIIQNFGLVDYFIGPSICQYLSFSMNRP